MRVVAGDAAIGICICPTARAANKRLFRTRCRANAERTNDARSDRGTAMATSPASRINCPSQHRVSVDVDVGGLRTVTRRERHSAAVVTAYLKVNATDVLDDAYNLRVSQIVIKGNGYRAVSGHDSTRNVGRATSGAGTNRNGIS